MYAATKTETEILKLLQQTPQSHTQIEQALTTTPPEPLQKAIEGCLAKNFIIATKDQKYALTPEGKNQI